MCLLEWDYITRLKKAHLGPLNTLIGCFPELEDGDSGEHVDHGRIESQEDKVDLTT